MSKQLDILALEPFFGGVRRSVLETLIRCSRHRWTLLKLPPRRIERRLTAAAHWFAEQLSRHWVGRVDLIFTSDTLNLADFYRLMPELADKPSVVYFHDNQLPPMGSRGDGPLDLVNLNSASSATEIWFNSKYHLEVFFERASYLVETHGELSSRNPIQHLISKTKLIPPPVDLGLVREVAEANKTPRQRRTLFVETRDANLELLNGALEQLSRRSFNLNLITVGPVDSLTEAFPRRTIPEEDVVGQISGLLQAPTFVSTKLGTPFDLHAVRALAAGCYPLMPNLGCYVEMLPQDIAGWCLYEPSPDYLASRLMDVWTEDRPANFTDQVHKSISQFDSITACKAIDEHLEQLVEKQPHR